MMSHNRSTAWFAIPLALLVGLALVACGQPPIVTPAAGTGSGSPVAEPALVGKLWILTAYQPGEEGDLAEALAGVQTTALFGEDGSLVGTTGCNSYTATYQAAGPNVVIGDAAATERACLEPSGLMAQESAYLADLTRVVSFEVTGDELILSDTAGAPLLAFVMGDASSLEGLSSPPPELAVQVLANMTYMSDYTASGEASLTDGVYREPAAPGSASEVVVTLTEPMAYFQLEEGEAAAAVVLATSTGGSGTFYDLALVVSQDGQAVNLAIALLGDRVQVNSVTISQGVVAVDMVTQGPDDPLCCPTQRVIQTYVVRRGELVEGSRTVIGTVESSG